MIETLLPFPLAFAVAWRIALVGASSPGPAVAMLKWLSFSQGRRAAMIAIFVVSCAVLNFAGHAAWALARAAAPVRAAFGRARRDVGSALSAVFSFAALTLATSRT